MAVRDELERVAHRTQRLLDAVRQVTLEEFHTEDAHFERDSRLGRELLFLIANNDWCRRTTEIVDIGKVQAVDTDIIVDVDLAYADHEAFQPEEGLIWLPLLALPALVPTHRPRGAPAPEHPEPITGVEVMDPSGARLPKMTQAEVHQRLAAALSEIVLNVMANRTEQAETGIGGEVDREQKLLLSAAIRRMLPGEAAMDRVTGERAVPAGVGNARARLDAALGRDLDTAWQAVAHAEAQAGDATSRGAVPYDDDDAPGGPPRPVMGSQVGEILDALIGTLFVVVAVDQPQGPLSYTVHVPSRRLRKFGGGWRRLQPRARLTIDLLAPTTHADRQIRLLLPDGIGCLDSERAGDRRTLARIDVILPGPFERLDTLMRRLFPATLAADRPVSWVDARIADMALHKADAALDCLRHYDVAAVGGEPPPPTRAGGMEGITTATQERLRRLREHLVAVVAAGPPTPSGAPAGPEVGEAGPMTRLHGCWAGGSWYPSTMRRRLQVNTASPDAVLFRATAIEDVTKRARPTRAQIDTEVAVSDSPLFNVARYAGTLNLVLLAAVSAMLYLQHLDSDADLQRELLATVLTLFSAVQASRVEHPDTSTLRGLLSQANYWMMLASILPTVLLAVALAVITPRYAAEAALVALLAQALLVLRLRLGPLAGSLRRKPVLTLATQFGPDHARADVLRGRRSRDLVAEALRLDREAFAYVVTLPAGEGQFESLLDRSQRVPPQTEERFSRMTSRAARALLTARFEASRNGGPGPSPEPETVNLLGVVQSATAGQAMSYLVFRERPAPGWMSADGPGPRSVHPVPLDPDRLAPMEPAEWTLEVVVGLPEQPVVMPLADHPLRTVLAATARYNFRVLSVQMPAPPPPGRRDGVPRRWLRLRIAVPYRRGDSLRGLGSFLHRVHRLDGEPFGEGHLVVDVAISPDRPDDPPPDAATILTDRDFDVVPDEEAAGDPRRRWRALAICGHARTGLLNDVLAQLTTARPTFALAGMTAALVHGQTVLLMLGRDSGPPDGDALSASLPDRLRPGDQMTVVVDDWQAARTLDGVPADDRLLLRVSIRTPDRPGVLREMLQHLEAVLAERAPAGVQVSGLDVWFVLLQVVDGRSTRGRLTVRLPGTRADWPAWRAVNWRGVGREVGRAAALSWVPERASHAAGWGVASPLLDDVVVTVDLLRTSAPLLTHPGAGRTIRLDAEPAPAPAPVPTPGPPPA